MFKSTVSVKSENISNAGGQRKDFATRGSDLLTQKYVLKYIQGNPFPR